MIKATKNLLEAYYGKTVINTDLITDAVYRCFVYHRLDMLLSQFPETVEYARKTDDFFLSKKEKISLKNRKYLNEIKRIATCFSEKSINYVILKGAAMILTNYKKIYHRYFSDIDILVDYENITQVQNILFGMGYVHGDIVDGNIVVADRKKIIHQQLHTHEIYKMVKIENGDVLQVDVNFLFGWKGFEKNNYKQSLENLSIYTKNVDLDGIQISIFNDEMQFVHLCCHLYNEATYFALDPQYVVGDDPKEFLLFRLFDILLIKMNKKLNIDVIHKIAIDMKVTQQIEYVITIINRLFGEEYILEFLQWFQITSDKLNVFYNSKGEKVIWPINIEDRIFDIKEKKNVIDKLKQGNQL